MSSILRDPAIRRGEAPAAAALDDLARARIRRTLAARFGDLPTLTAHVELLDTRGAWYAARAMHAWPTHQGDSFFGVVRHVVRTQLAGPPSAPDLEAWLAAGRPEDLDLGHAWDLLGAYRYPPGRRPAAHPRDGAISDAVADFDAVLRSWPEGEFEQFALAYAKVEHVLERREITLPPIDR